MTREERLARVFCYWANPTLKGTCHDTYCGTACRAIRPNKEFYEMARIYSEPHECAGLSAALSALQEPQP